MRLTDSTFCHKQFVFTKLFSVVPNSMNDERTGSRMTFLFSKLRSRTDVNTMVEQIQVKQWYELVSTIIYIQIVTV